MPSKNMLPKGQRRRSVRAEYRKLRTELEEQKARETAQREAEFLPEPEPEDELYDTADFLDEELPDPSNPYLRNYVLPGSRNAEDTPAEPRYPGLQTFVTKTAPEIQVLEDLEPEDGVRRFTADPAAAGLRLDAYLAKALPDISRARVQMLIDNGQVKLDNQIAKGKTKLKGGEAIEIEGEPRPEPLRAEPEDIPLEIVYEDADLAVINKPAGMNVHAGAGSAEQNRGTLVNALLFHFGKELSSTGGELRPGIVHRLDKETSGLIVVAKNDSTHRKLGEMFAEHELRKVYVALVQGHLAKEEGTIDLPISRDVNRRTRMTTRRTSPDARARDAVSHYRVLERLETPFGRFTLVEVEIETGRTHQIRVHLQALGHPVVGDTLYGAREVLKLIAGARVQPGDPAVLVPGRNFLHAAELDFAHPRSGKPLAFRAGLPPELTSLLEALRVSGHAPGKPAR